MVELVRNRRLRESTQLYENFKYKLVETPKTIKLIEIFLGNEAEIGQVRSWKTYARARASSAGGQTASYVWRLRV